jgi:polysaccharide export outer membrane protein
MSSWKRPAIRCTSHLIFLAAVPIAAFSGCSSLRNAHATKHIAQLGAIDPHQPRELQKVSLPTYVIEPPDELEVTVRPVPPDFPTSNLIVRGDGNLDLGFSGDVYVSGLTLGQAEQKIADQLAARDASAKAPSTYRQVSVRLVSGATSKTYYVLGSVATQGRFPSTGNETVLDAILQAGLKSHSVPEKSYLVRPHPAGGPDQVLKIDWIGIKERGDTLTNYQVFPGDRIIVPGTKPPSMLRSLLSGG